MKLLKRNINFIKEMKLLFFSNYFIWMIIILLPILESLLMGRIIYNINILNFSYTMLLVFLLLGFLRIILVYIGGILDTIVRYKVVNKLHLSSINNMMKSKSENNSEVLNIIENDSAVVSEYVSLVIDFLCHVCYYTIAIIIMMSINFFIACLIVVFAIFSSLIHKTLNTKLSKYNNIKRKHSIKITNIMENSLKNKTTLFSLQNRSILKKYDEAINKYNKAAKKEKITLFLINQIGINSVNIQILLIFILIPFISISEAEVFSVITFLLLGLASIDMFLEMASLTTITKNAYQRIDSINSEPKNNSYTICRKDSILFYGTIADNVCLWDVDKSKLEEVLKFVNIYDELVHRDIYTYIVDENTTTLSLGQKCRIILARSIYNAKDIVYYENIFEHIDQQSVEIIFNNINCQSDLKFIKATQLKELI